MQASGPSAQCAASGAACSRGGWAATGGPRGWRRRNQLERELSREQVSEDQRRGYLDKLEARERDYTRLQRQRMCCDDFEPLTLIGRGAFGEVRASRPNQRTSCCNSSCLTLFAISRCTLCCRREALHAVTGAGRGGRRRCGCAGSGRRGRCAP